MVWTLEDQKKCESCGNPFTPGKSGRGDKCGPCIERLKSLNSKQLVDLWEIVAKHRKHILADECEPEDPMDLWMDLTAFFESLEENKGPDKP